MLGASVLLAGTAAVAAATGNATCAPPAVCNQPPATFVKVVSEHPRQQWNYNGGFCGAFSLQTLMMTRGAWVSEDLVRKANIGAPCFGHGNGPNSTICQSKNDTECISSAPLGCEVGPENYAETCAGLRLRCDVWDYTQPKPQASDFKRWMKLHLVNGFPVVWVPMLKGASNTPYGPRSCPGGGHFNHHEPVLGIGSNRSLGDTEAYDDDWIAHLSDEDEGELVTYYRTFGSLDDTPAMDGNCLHADSNRSCAYPCFDTDVTYGIAVKGFERTDYITMPLRIDVDRDYEPDPREGQQPVPMHATIEVSSLEAGRKYTLYSFRGFNAFPATGVDGYDTKLEFTAANGTTKWSYRDPKDFLSDSAVYYMAVESSNKRTLSCSTQSGIASFHAVLDDSHFAPGSGYFDVIDANIVDNYHAAQLLCEGSNLQTEIDCVGYDNGIGSTIMQVTVTPTGSGGMTASYRFVDIGGAVPAARPPQTKGPWECTVSE